MSGLTREEAADILRSDDREQQAEIIRGANLSPNEVQKIVIPLDVAQAENDPKEIGFPFRSLFVVEATDTSTVINVRPGTKAKHQAFFPLTKRDAFYRSKPFNRAYLHWDAQPGKSITILIFLNAEFRSGSQISVNSGGVSINDGSAISGPTRVVLAATTATIIAPASSTRKKTTIQNKTGADLYIGGATIAAVGGVSEGIKIAADGIIVWRNTAALYGWSVAGGNIHYTEES